MAAPTAALRCGADPVLVIVVLLDDVAEGADEGLGLGLLEGGGGPRADGELGPAEREGPEVIEVDVLLAVA